MTSPFSRPAPYVFGRFTLAADASLLTDADVPVPLAPKVLQTLRALLAHAGRVVTKHDLIREVWGGSFVEEGGLARNISVLRRALGDDGPRCIVTVPRIGYRFVLQAVPETCEDEPVATDRTFVGRTPELSLLHQLLQRAHAGRGSVIGITGEPGIGKTTLPSASLPRCVRRVTSPWDGPRRSSARRNPSCRSWRSSESWRRSRTLPTSS